MKKHTAVPASPATKLGECHQNAVQALSETCKAMSRLLRLREKHKLSNNRMTAVASELADLLRVLTEYEK
jgi:hypothetical protein